MLRTITLCLLTSATGYLGLLARQVMCQEFSQCYNDVNICLWTNGSQLTKYAAQSACEQRHSFLPRITNSNIQSKLGEFRPAAGNLLGINGFWIDVRAVSRDNFHWIDGSPLAGRFSTLLYIAEVLRIDCSSIGVNKS